MNQTIIPPSPPAPRASNTPNMGNGIGNGDIQLIFQANVHALPRPTVDKMNLALHRGADSQKRATETVGLSGTKYSDK